MFAAPTFTSRSDLTLLTCTTPYPICARRQMKDYYQLVYDRMVTSVRNQTAYLIYSPWAREMVAEHHVDYEGALDLSQSDVVSDSGYCLLPGSNPDQVTLAFYLADATIRYAAYKQFVPLAYQVCAEPQALCQGAANVMGFGGASYVSGDSMQGHDCSFSTKEVDFTYSGCFGSAPYCSASPESFELCVSSKLADETGFLFRPEGSVATLSNEPNPRRDGSDFQHVCGSSFPTGICFAMRKFTATRVNELDWASNSYMGWLCGFDPIIQSWNSERSPQPPASASKGLVASIDLVTNLFMPPNATWTCQPESSTAACPTLGDLAAIDWHDEMVQKSWDARFDGGESCSASFACTEHGEPGLPPCQMHCMLTSPMQDGVVAPLIPCPGKPFLRCPNAADLALIHTWTAELHDAWDAGPVGPGQSFTCRNPLDCMETGSPCNMHCINPWNPRQPFNEMEAATSQSQGTPGQTLSNIVKGSLLGNPTRTPVMQDFGWLFAVQRLPNGPLLRSKYFQTIAFNNLRDHCGTRECDQFVLDCGQDCKNQRTFFSEGCCGDATCAAQGAPADTEEGKQCWPTAMPNACSTGLACKPWNKGFQNLWGCCTVAETGHCDLPPPSMIAKHADWDVCIDTAGHGTLVALQSPNGQYTLRLQAEDGNVVLYGPNGAEWEIGACGGGTSNVKLCMQADGNFVVYRNGCEPWDAASYRAAYLTLQDDANLVAYQASATYMNAHDPQIIAQFGLWNQAVWASKD